MVNTNFNIELEKDSKKEEINIVIQEVSPFTVANLLSSALDPQTRTYRMGTVVEKMLDTIVVSPKNLKEKIEESDNALDVIGTLFTEFQNFCGSPKAYALKRIEEQRKEESKDLEHGDTKLDTDRDKKHE